MATITLLNAEPKILAKRFTIDGKIDYDRTKWYEYVPFEATDIFTLSEVLTALEGLSTHCVIRGKLMPDVTSTMQKKVLRRKDAYEGERAYFEENRAGVEWMLLDFDKRPADPALTPDERLEYLISQLPDYLQEVTYHYQWSASAGVANEDNPSGWDLLNCHIWMWLKYPRTDSSMCRWADIADVDDAAMRTVQPLYTANPIFEGVTDPLVAQGIARSGLVRRQFDAAVVPEILTIASTYDTKWVKKEDGGMVKISNSGFYHQLSTIGSRLHMPIQRSICAWLASTTDNSDKGRLKEILKDAISRSGRSDTALYLSDRYLDQCIESATRKIKSAEFALPYVPDPNNPIEILRGKIARGF